MLIEEKHGTKFGWTLSPFKPYLSKISALIVGICQLAFTIILPLIFLTNFFSYVFCSFHTIIFPISIIVWMTVYLTSVREPLHEQYNFSKKEITIYIGVYLLASIWIFYTIQYSPPASIYDPTSVFCSEVSH
jgi:hypothetical protein